MTIKLLTIAVITGLSLSSYACVLLIFSRVKKVIVPPAYIATAIDCVGGQDTGFADLSISCLRISARRTLNVNSVEGRGGDLRPSYSWPYGVDPSKICVNIALF